MARRKDDVYEVEILGWEKYNPGGKKQLWFRFESSITTGVKWEKMPPAACKLYVMLLAKCATRGSSGVAFGARLMSELLLIRQNTLLGVLNSLEHAQWIRVVRTPYERTNERTNGTLAIPSGSIPPDDGVLVHDPPPKKSSKTKRVDMSVLHPIAELWNQHCGKLPKVDLMTSKRASGCKALECRPREELVRVIATIASSRWHLGENDRGWKADFNFFLRPDKYAEALEGGGSFSRKSRSTIAGYDGLAER